MLKKHKEIFIELLAESYFEFDGIKDKINTNKWIYHFKTESRSPKDFKGYQNSLELFENLRDGDVNPKKVLKNQV